MSSLPIKPMTTRKIPSLNLRSLLLSLLVLAHLILAANAYVSGNPTTASSTTSTTPTTPTDLPLPPKTMSETETSTIKVVFSDVDGTLVHYPKSMPDNANDNSNTIVRLPPSATGLQGIISSQTLQQCQQIRAEGVKLVLVSGMRTTTLLKRLPFLPKADAYCSEAGGRIFWSRPIASTTQEKDDSVPSFAVTPVSYEGANTEPFEIVEDMEWRRRMQRDNAAGQDGYGPSAELPSSTTTQTQPTDTDIPVGERKGALWEFANQLVAKGYVLDTKGYAACFRVNRKQQPADNGDSFDRLLQGQVLPCPAELATSTNLGCIDYYPVDSGKKNCCRYVANRLLEMEQQDGSIFRNDKDKDDNDNVLSKHCVCLCDDDNDLEMALACHHAFIPGISSTSMADIIANHPNHFSQTGGRDHDGLEGTIATEKALTLVLQRIANTLRP